MKLIKLSLVAALFTTAIYAGNEEAIISTDDFEASANVALTSDYVWRGSSLTNEDMAIQGGMDLEYKGIYVGVWASNIAQLEGETNNNTTTIETDVYAGYAGEIDKFSYDVGYCQYMYINLSKELNFGEAYVGLGYDFDVVAVGAKYSFGIKTNEYAANNHDNVEVTASVPLPWELSFDMAYGMFENMNDYYYTSISRDFGKFNVNLAYTGRTSATYGHSYFGNPNRDGNYNGERTKDFFVATLGASF